VHVTTCLYGFLGMQCMLEIRRADDHGIDVLAVIQFIVVAYRFDLLSGFSLDVFHRLITTAIPNIGYGGEFKIQLFGTGQHGRRKGTAKTGGETHDTDIDAIIGPNDPRITTRRKSRGRQRYSRCRKGGLPDKLSSGDI